MSLVVAARIARRELRGGLRGFRVFLACLVLGIGAISAVGVVRESISIGLAREGAALLGGDAEIQLTHRFANEAERAWIESVASTVSSIVDFRSMAVTGQGAMALTGLTQVKAIDAVYPIYGAVRLNPDIDLTTALDGENNHPGAVMDQLLVDKLGLSTGALFRLGTQEFVLSAVLLAEPDNGAGAFMLGPRTIVRKADLSGSGLLQDGSLFDASYRLKLPENVDMNALQIAAQQVFDAGGLRWRDRRNGAPGVSAFVERLGAFLVLVGLAGIAVGGVGVSAAVRAYLEEKVRVIATLKALGATARTIFQVYMFQIGVLGAFGVILGLLLGGLLPLVLAPAIKLVLPIPAVFGFHLQPLSEAAIYGVLAAIMFTVWPLSRSVNVRSAALYRDSSLGLSGLPDWRYLMFTGVVLTALIAAVLYFSSSWRLSIWAVVSIASIFIALIAMAWLLRKIAGRLAKSHKIVRAPMLRLAFSSVAGPNSEANSVVLSLGLGLSVLAAVGQIDSNLQSAIERDLPKVAPSFFVIDVQPDQFADFNAQVMGTTGVKRQRTAPMMRGLITKINGKTATEVVGDHWVISGDRGLTFSAQPPEGTKLTKGAWWGKDYSGPPQISFAATEAEEMGLVLGDTITISVLGRDITATITSFREVDFSGAGMGFVLAINPAAVAGAPYTILSTIYATKASEAGLLRDLNAAFPNITLISVRSAIERVAAILQGIAAAITYGAMATLITGFVVLIGAAATGARRRTYEASVLKTLGATRIVILSNFLLRSLIFGAAASLVAVIAGAAAGWAVIERVMDSDYYFDPVSAAAVLFTGVFVTLLAGIGFSLKSLNARPSGVLRAFE